MKFQRMLVAVDLTEMDRHVVKYASMVAGIFKMDAVYFLHITSSLELPEEIREKYGNILAPVDETLEKEVEATVNEYFIQPANCDVKIEIQTGTVADEVLRYARVKVADLIVLGRKKELVGSGLNAKRVARNSSSSIIFVPEHPSCQLSKILVAIDYSHHAKMAFEIGISLQKKSGAKLLSNNVYRVPVGYAKSGKTYAEFAKIMLRNAQKECERFFSKINLKGVEYEHTYILDDDPYPADKIYKKGVEEQVDMIILGSRGRSGSAAFLIGSVAEKLVIEDNDIPVFLVKKNNENMNFLQALFRL